MPLPDDILDESKNYRIRLCVLVADAAVVFEGSKIHPCDGCEELVWVDEQQEIPPVPDGQTVDGDLNLCRDCTRSLGGEMKTPIDFLDQPWVSPALRDFVRDYYGLGSP